MVIRINQRDICIITVNIIASVIMVIFNSYLTNNIYTACVVANIISLYTLISAFSMRDDKGIILSIFTLIYHACAFGRVSLIYLLDYKSEYYFDSFSRFGFTNTELAQAVYLSSLCLLGLLTGMALIFGNETYKSEIITNEENVENEKRGLLYTANILFAISIIPALLDYANQFSTKYIGGAFLYGGLSTAIGILADMIAIPVIIYVLLGDGKADWISLIYYASQILLGGRGKPICMIVTIILLRSSKKRSTEKVRFGKIVLLFVGVFIAAAMFTALARTRSKGWEYLSTNFWSTFLACLAEQNPIFELEYELGVALAPLIGLMRYTPSVVGFQYGKAIICSAICMIPDMFGIIPDSIQELGNIATTITTINGTTYGALMVQDFYFNFGMLAPLAIIPAGILITKVSVAVSNLDRYSLTKVVFLAAMIFPILWWPRSSLGYMARYFGTVIVIPYVIYKVFGKVNRAN